MPSQSDTPLPLPEIMLDPLMLSLLRCPTCEARPALKIAGSGGDALFCGVCGRTYSIKNGVPYLLVDEDDNGGEKPKSDAA